MPLIATHPAIAYSRAMICVNIPIFFRTTGHRRRKPAAAVFVA
jgi:hypothetical protein